MRTRAFATAIPLVAALLLNPAPSRGEAAYHVTRRFPLGGEGGWDYITYDAAANRLYVARGTHVQVVDAGSGAPVGDITGQNGVHGVVILHALGRGFITNGRDSSLSIFDLKTLAEVRRVPVTGSRPDAILYDPKSRRIFTFNAGGNATVLDPSTGQVVGTVALGGKPEAGVADGRGKIYVNIEDTAEIVCFDARSLAIIGRWPLAPTKRPTGLAFDGAHHRLFVGCSHALLVVSADSGRVVANFEIPGGCDGVVYDPGTRLVIASCGTGALGIVRQDGADRYTKLPDVPTEYGARTVALDPAHHTLYLPTARFQPAPPDSTGAPRYQDKPDPDSFFIVEVAH